MKTRVLERYPHPQFKRLTVQLRNNSRFFQAATFIDKQLQKSLKTTHLPTAFKLAADWYKRELRASAARDRQHPYQRLTADPTMGELFREFVSGLSESRQRYANMKWGPISDFWKARTVSSVSFHTLSEFYQHRRRKGKIKNHTLHKDVILLRQLVGLAHKQGLIDALPSVPDVGEIEPNGRPWLSETQWDHLKRCSLRRIGDAPNARLRQQRRDLHDAMEFLIASMMRVGELYSLRFPSCEVETNSDGDKFLLCEVDGKSGIRTVVAQRSAANVFARRRREASDKDGLIFPRKSTDALRELLVAANLRVDASGFRRNMKSLRATSISFGLLRASRETGRAPDLLAIARNAGTSVLMIDKFYAKALTADMYKEMLSRLPTDAFRKPTPAKLAANIARLKKQLADTKKQSARELWDFEPTSPHI